MGLRAGYDWSDYVTSATQRHARTHSSCTFRPWHVSPNPDVTVVARRVCRNACLIIQSGVHCMRSVEMHGVQCLGNFQYLPSARIRIVFGPSAKAMACEVHMIHGCPAVAQSMPTAGATAVAMLTIVVTGVKGAWWNSLGQLSPQDLPVPQRCIGLSSVPTGMEEYSIRSTHTEYSRVLLFSMKTVAPGTSPR